MTNDTNKESPDFYGLGIAPKLLEILEQLKFAVPTPIQFQSIPITVEGKDMVGIAQTGTGKTLAFGIPMLQRLARHQGRGLILLPTRELAQQVDESLKVLGDKLGLRTAVLIGGEPINRQFFALKKKPHVLVATPGRLIDHIERKTVNLEDTKIVVLDEADLMFDMGFAPQIESVMKTIPTERQTMLFSATMDPAVMRLATKYMNLPIRIEVAPAGTPAENVIQEMIVLKKDDKLIQLQKTLNEYSGSVLIFARTKHGVKNLCRKLQDMNFSAAEIHSNRSLMQRRQALSGFKNGRFRILVATDIAARGIDVSGIEIVLNYDLPDNSEDYVHRIGRTGRAGKKGRSISFALPDQVSEIKKIEKLINTVIPLTLLAKPRPGAKPKKFGRRRSSGSRRPMRSQNKSNQKTSRYKKRLSGFSSPSQSAAKSEPRRVTITKYKSKKR